MKISDRDHLFQNMPETIVYSNEETIFIQSLVPFQGGEWDKSFTGTGRPRGTGSIRKRLKDSIGFKLRNIQYPHCIYCGFHENIVGNLQREHIAPKDLFHGFVFEAENLILACGGCNGFKKKHIYNTVSKFNLNYKLCTFNIIHPYRDRFQDHLDFNFNNNNLFIWPKKYSRKGRNTITLFCLDDVRQTSLRAATLLKRHIRLDLAQEALIQEALTREYRT